MAKRAHGARPAVVFFDIDGTLVRGSGPHHRRSLERAVAEVTGLKATTENIPVAGMLDRKILEAMLETAGATRALARRVMPDLVRAAQRHYSREAPASLIHAVCPGVRAALHRLRRRRIPAGLVTGNLSRIGWKKMELAALSRFFSFGAFAEQAEDREGLVSIAVRHARNRGWVGESTPVWLVGDHPNDVGAARANRVRVLAVATGVIGRDALAASKPDLVLDDLRGFDPGVLLA